MIDARFLTDFNQNSYVSANAGNSTQQRVLDLLALLYADGRYDISGYIVATYLRTR
jgi:hypothetical protein